MAQAPESAAGDPVIQEVVVVAQKREQYARDVPVAISVFDSNDIRDSGMETLVKLTDLHPSVSFETAQSFQRSSLKIRGIGTIGNTRSFEGAVGVFVDGAYRPRSGMVLSDLLDIDRIEVLRGPQSTLYGKNTVAGSISLYSARPGFDALYGDLEVRAGNLDYIGFKGSVNAPVTDSLAFRFAGSLDERDGTFVSPDNGDSYDTVDRYGFKAQMLFEPQDDLRLHIVADRSESDAHCCWGSAISVNGPTTPLIDVYSSLNGLTLVQAPDAERTRAQSLNTLPGEKIEDSGVVATIDWDLGGKSLKSVTSVRDWTHSQIDADADFVGADLFTLWEPASIKVRSQELSLTIPLRESDDLLVGVYFAEEEYRSTRYVENGSDADNYLNALISAAEGSLACLPPVIALDCLFPTGVSALLDDGEFSSEYYYQDGTTLAAFAHGTFAISDTVRIVSGLRYSEEDKDGGVDNLFWYDSAIARAALAAAGVPDDGTPRNGLDLIGTVYSPSFADATGQDEVSGTFSVQYSPGDSLMFFAGYHRGYKAGGINLFREGVVTNATTYKPEFAESVELGLKGSYWRNRGRFDLSVFDTDFTDLQINFFSGLDFRTENTGKSRTRGLEIDTQVRLTDSLEFALAVTHLDSKFLEIRNPSIAYLIGRDTPRAPDWASVMSLDYDRSLTANLDLFARFMLAYTGAHYVGSEVPGEEKVGGYSIYDASLGIRSNEGNWELVAWCSNCTDKTYRTIYFNTTFQPGTYSSYLNLPRRYGLTLRAHFGT